MTQKLLVEKIVPTAKCRKWSAAFWCGPQETKFYFRVDQINPSYKQPAIFKDQERFLAFWSAKPICTLTLIGK